MSFYYGIYFYVIFKDMMVFVIVSDVGIGLMRVDDVIVVFKSFLMRVGVGLFLIEMF